jgi:hypothetical protein
MPKFNIEFPGDFYTSTLYDKEGKEVFTLKEAVQAAFDVYGENWGIVFNGEQALTRESVPESWKNKT